MPSDASDDLVLLMLVPLADSFVHYPVSAIAVAGSATPSVQVTGASSDL